MANASALLEAALRSLSEAGVSVDPDSSSIESLRSIAAGEKDVVFFLRAIDTAVGQAGDDGTRQQLSHLRSCYEDALAQAVVNAEETDWTTLIWTVANLVGRFRLEPAARICELASGLGGERAEQLKALARDVKHMEDGRWVEAFGGIVRLSEQVDDDALRARLFVMLAEIERYYFGSVTRAASRLNQAHELAPDDPRILSARGDDALESGQMAQAISLFRKSAEVEPDGSYGYAGLGDCYAALGDFETAVSWYDKSIEHSPGSPVGYKRLIQLAAKPERFEVDRLSIPGWIERVASLTPDELFDTYLTAGTTFKENRRFREAHEWYERAIELAPQRPSAYVSDGHCFLDEDKLDDAERRYREAIAIAPEAHDGCFGMAWRHETRSEWDKAREWYEKSPRTNDGLSGFIDSKIGTLLVQLEQTDEGEAFLWKTIEDDAGHDFAVYGLQLLADRIQEDGSKFEDAKRIEDRLLDLLGDRYAGDYHNRIGNVLYANDDYDGSAREYRLAIDAKPDSAVFHRNLAGSLRGLGVFDEAIAELEAAYRIDLNPDTLNQQKALVMNAWGNQFYAQGDYERAAELYKEAVELDATDDVIFSNLGGALERIKLPGQRLPSLDDALDAYERANVISSKNEYENSISRVRDRRRIGSLYGENALDWAVGVKPIRVEVASNLVPLIEGETAGALAGPMAASINAMRERFRSQLGISIPGISFRDNTGLGDGTYVFALMEVPLVLGQMEPDWFFVPDPAQVGDLDPDTSGAAINPTTGDHGLWLDGEVVDTLRDAGVELWDSGEYMTRHLEAVVRKNVAEFVGHEEIAVLLAESPTVEKPVTPKRLTAFVTVARALVSEGVPLRSVGAIFEQFRKLYSADADHQSIVEAIRSAPFMRNELPGNSHQGVLETLDLTLEETLRASIQNPNVEPVLALEPETCQNVLTDLRNTIGGRKNVSLVVDDARIRPYLRSLANLEFPSVHVVSRRELLEPTSDTAEDREPVAYSSGRVLRPDGSRNVGGPWHPPTLSETVAVSVYVSDELSDVQTPADDNTLAEALSLMRDGLFNELGIMLPVVRLDNDPTLRPNEFRFNLNGRAYPRMSGLDQNEYLVNDTVERLKLLDIHGRRGRNPATGLESTIVEEDQTASAACDRAGLTTWGPAGYLVLTLAAEIRKTAASFQTVEATRYLLDTQRSSLSSLVDAALDRFSVAEIALVLRELLEEELSIRNLRSILESMLSVNGTTNVDLGRYIVFTGPAQILCPAPYGWTIDRLGAEHYANVVRRSMGRYIAHKHTGGGNTLTVFLIDPAIERRIADLETGPLSGDEIARLGTALRSQLGDSSHLSQKPVILTSVDVRKRLRQLIAPEFPDLAVLSYQELPADLNVQPMARVSWD